MQSGGSKFGSFPFLKRTHKTEKERFDVFFLFQVALGHEQSNVLPIKSQRKRIAKHELYSNAEAMNSVMNKAEEIKASLPDDHPSFIKTMLHSHVTIGFWLGFCREFCDDHMPMVDQNVELEDENGVIWTAKYLAGKLGLSGGWRKFSVDHHLVEGDVLVFQLVRPTKFKVYPDFRFEFVTETRSYIRFMLFAFLFCSLLVKFVCIHE
ncbi:B3 domain-containing protein Os01g0234100 [Linum perenne]